MDFFGCIQVSYGTKFPSDGGPSPQALHLRLHASLSSAARLPEELQAALGQADPAGPNIMALLLVLLGEGWKKQVESQEILDHLLK